MGPIIKLTDAQGTDWYLLWSTEWDAPATCGMSREELEALYREEYGRQGMRDFEDRMQRVEQYGTSCLPPCSAESYVTLNRAGDNETQLTLEELIAEYCAPDDDEEDDAEAPLVISEADYTFDTLAPWAFRLSTTQPIQVKWQRSDGTEKVSPAYLEDIEKMPNGGLSIGFRIGDEGATPQYLHHREDCDDE